MLGDCCACMGQWPWVTRAASYQWASSWKLEVAKVKGMPWPQRGMVVNTLPGWEEGLGRAHLHPSLFSLAQVVVYGHNCT